MIGMVNRFPIRQLLRAFLPGMVLLLSLAVAAQPMASVIKAQAVDMGRALVAQDLETFSQYMHPTLVQKAGGPAKMRAMADTMSKVFKQFGASVNRVVFGNPADIIKYQKTLQTTLPQTTYLKTSFADIELESTLVAISMDGGKHWYFIDTAVYRESALRKDLPDISPSLQIPPPAQPKIIPKEQ
jgi:hypothetical protein